jgi:hypothetical protein
MDPMGLSSLWASHKERPILISSMETAPQIPPSRMNLSYCLLKQSQLYQPCINIEKTDKETRHVYVCVGVLYTSAEHTHTHTHIHPPKNTHTKQSFCLQLEEWQCWRFWTNVENSPQHQNPEEQWQEATLLQDLHPCIPDLRKKGM